MKKNRMIRLRLSLVAHQARAAYLGFYAIKQQGVFVFRPGWNASPSGTGLPPSIRSSAVPIYTPGWREALRECSVFPKNTTQCPRPGLEPRTRSIWS